MADEIKANLEPINEGETNLKENFLGGVLPEKKADDAVPKEEIIVTPESVTENLEKKEGAAEKDEAYAKIISKVSATPAVPAKPEEISGDAMKVNQETDAESKINNLVNLAQTKSIAHAVNVARHLEDNYVLDEFHDRLLSQELHDALVKKGIIKEI